MNIDYSPRGAGKTTRAIEWLRKDLENRWMVVHSLQEMARLTKEYPDCDGRITTWDAWLKMKGKMPNGNKTPRIMIDDADMFLQRMFDWNVTDVTFTKDEISLREV